MDANENAPAVSAEGDPQRTRGLWWKSLFFGWLVTRPIGSIVTIVGVDPPSALGVVVLGGAWLAVYLAMRRRSEHEAVNSPLKLMQNVTVAFLIAVLSIGMVVDILRRDGGVPSAGIAAVPAAFAVSILGLLIVGALAVGVPALRSAGTEGTVGLYRSRFFIRLTLAELPAFAAFGAVLLTGNPALYLIGLAASLASFFLIHPTAARVREDEARLAEMGVGLTRFAGQLGCVDHAA